jgi:hypothetical protein
MCVGFLKLGFSTDSADCAAQGASMQAATSSAARHLLCRQASRLAGLEVLPQLALDKPVAG